ncbi:hypothetical protein ACHAWT_000714 [Skeletonema menzelii]
MKFTIIALAGALASANAHQLRSNVRKLEGANAYQAQLDGSANISFAKCIEVTVQPDNDENIQAAIQGGTAKPVKSFAAFYTNSYANDNEMMMVDLGTYVAGKVSASAMKTRQMCETCREFEETCNPEQNYEYGNDGQDNANQDNANDAEGEDAEGEDANDAERKLTAVAIDSDFCYTCQNNGCYVEEEDNGQVNYEEQVSQYFENVADCMEVENYVDANGNGVYIGMTCSSYGDAAELAVFLDEECTVETNQLSATSVLASVGANDEGVSMSYVHSQAITYLQEAFTTSLSCEQIEYYDPNEGYEANNNGEVQISEACNQIAGEALLISTCYIQNDEQEEDAQDEDQWYNFDVQDGGDLQEACAVVNYKLQAGEDFEFFYDETTQGTVGYDRDFKGNLKSSESGSGMSGGVIFLIVALVAGIVIAPIAWLIKTKKNTQASESDYQGGTLS